MANYSDLNIGQINQTGDPNALFLKVFSGEVLKAFKLSTITESLVMKRSIVSGKSAQFPVTGWLQAHYTQPGAELTGQQGVQNEKIIIIDDLLVADSFISNLEEAKNHYDIRSIYSTESGNALARAYDNKNIRVMILAARASANLSANAIAAPAAPVLTQSAQASAAYSGSQFFKLTLVTAAGETLPSTEATLTVTTGNVVQIAAPSPSDPRVTAFNVYGSATTGTEVLQNTYPIPIGYDWTEPTTGLVTGTATVPTASTATGPTGTFAGNSVVAAGSATTAATLRTAILNALQALDQNNVPREGRFVLLKPAQYWLLFTDVTFGFIGNQFFGGAGSLAKGNLPEIGGAQVHVSNNFPAAGVVTAQQGEQNTYSGDFTNTVCVVGHPSAIGVVSLMEVASEMQYMPWRQGTFMVSRMAKGVGTLRPEAMYEIKNA